VAPPRPAHSFSRADLAVALTAALLSFAVYLLTTAPTVTGEDCGEFATAAYYLGIPHPPGYPLWCMAAHLFTFLPWGTVAWRVALMSGFFASATVFLITLLGIALTRNRWAGAAAALALAFSLEFWEQSVIVEAYTLNAFFTALCLLFLWRWYADRRDLHLAALAVTFGLSLGNHYTMVLLGPLFAVFILAVDRITLARLGRYAAFTLLAAVVTLLTNLYLPLRSLANPPIDWGNPETLTNFWSVLRREQFAFMFTQYPRSLARFARQMGVLGEFWTQQFGCWPISAAGAAGLAVLTWRRPWHGLQLLALALLVLAGSAYVQNFNFDKEWLGVISVLGIPAYLVTAIGLSVFLDVLKPPRGSTGNRCLSWTLALAVSAGCVACPLLVNYRVNDRSDYYWAEDYGRNVLATLEPGAVYIPETDHGSFPVLYLQAIDGLRPDVTLGRKCGYLESFLFQDMPEDRRALYGEFPRRRYEPEIFAWFLTHSERPVYFGQPPRLSEGTGITFAPAGLLYRAVRPGETVPERDYWASYTWHTLDPADARGDEVAQLILYEISFFQARDAFHAGHSEQGLALVEKALRDYGRDDVVLNNAGVLCARFGLYEPARGYFRGALERNPENQTARNNLDRLQRRGEATAP
jgi:hypothetical protein